MNLVRIKKASELNIPGISLELQDGAIHGFVVKSPEGDIYVRSDSTYSNINVFRRQDFKEVERFVLSGNVLGLPVNESYEYESAAQTRLEELSRVWDSQAKFPYEGLAITKQSVKVEVE